MATEVALASARNCTLYDVEDNLVAFANRIDSPSDDPARQQLLDEIGHAIRTAREKRDAVAAFLHQCDQQLKFADAEVKRIEKRKAVIARVREELEQYVIHVIEEFAPADRRGMKRLEGNVSSLRIQKNPDSVLITDASAIPLRHKGVVLTMPAYVWEALLRAVGSSDREEFESRVEKLEFKPDKKSIAADLKTGFAVPGADLKFGAWRLVIS